MSEIKYNKYKLYQKYEKIDGEFVPVEQYKAYLKEIESEDCGFEDICKLSSTTVCLTDRDIDWRHFSGDTLVWRWSNGNYRIFRKPLDSATPYDLAPYWLYYGEAYKDTNPSIVNPNAGYNYTLIVTKKVITVNGKTFEVPNSTTYSLGDFDRDRCEATTGMSSTLWKSYCNSWGVTTNVYMSGNGFKYIDATDYEWGEECEDRIQCNLLNVPYNSEYINYDTLNENGLIGLHSVTITPCIMFAYGDMDTRCSPEKPLNCFAAEYPTGTYYNPTILNHMVSSVTINKRDESYPLEVNKYSFIGIGCGLSVYCEGYYSELDDFLYWEEPAPFAPYNGKPLISNLYFYDVHIENFGYDNEIVIYNSNKKNVTYNVVGTFADGQKVIAYSTSGNFDSKLDFSQGDDYAAPVKYEFLDGIKYVDDIDGNVEVIYPKSLEKLTNCQYFKTSKIKYNGTIAEWLAVEKEECSFDTGTVVHCSDGDYTY